MPAFSSTALSCLDLAAAAAPGMIDRIVAAAVAAMQDEELRTPNVARRQELAEAWLELQQRRRDWRERYAQLLRSAPDDAAPAPIATVPGTGRRALALVDDDALAQSLEAARMKQLLAPRLEQPLAELDALMSSALGLATVQPERNPLRPEVFARSLRTLMHPPGRPAWPGLWMRHLANPMAGELEQLYRQALEVLREARVEAASYRVLPAAGAPAAAPAAAPPGPPGPAAHSTPSGAAPGEIRAPGTGWGGGSGLGGSAWADLSAYGRGDELFQHFLFARSPPSQQELAPAFYAQVDAQLAALEAAPDDEEPFDPEGVLALRRLPAVERPYRAAGTGQPLDGSVWGRWAPARERALFRAQLKSQARQVGQVLGLEVVHQLVDQVARDARLLAPVREAVVALEPALLRLALLSPRFFGEEEHAGRRLVERVAERSFRYNDEFGADFRSYFADVRLAFQVLNEARVASAQPFAQALEHLESRWAAQDEIDARGRDAALEAVHFAEARDTEAGAIAWSISQRADLEGAPAVVQDFLYGPWSLVLAHARVAGGDPAGDPGDWDAVVADLLWSVKPQQALRDPQRLIGTIPGLLERLRRGLAVLGQDASENDSFFQALEQLHRPVLKLRARSRQGPAAPERTAELDPALLATERQQPRRGDADPWMAPCERKVAGFEEDLVSQPVPLAEEQAPAGIEGLQEGSWVDLCANGEWRRACLTWVSGRGTLFMFVSAGGRPHSMTLRTLRRLLGERLLRPVATGAVVQRAIEQLSHHERDHPLAA